MGKNELVVITAGGINPDYASLLLDNRVAIFTVLFIGEEDEKSFSKVTNISQGVL